MGKSPGRWIKTVLFGKKHSKSNLPKSVATDKKSAAKKSAEDVLGNSSVISDPYMVTDKSAESLEFENSLTGNLSDTIAPSLINQDVESQNSFVSVPVSNVEIWRQVQAASKLQSTFRGYLARRSFRALKGIIWLQALIRGHLVRRQAVATLHCMQAVVKFQALARGRRVRLSETRPALHKKCIDPKFQDLRQADIGENLIFRSEKLATNAYICELVQSLPTALPLCLQYDPVETNSAWNWLERWSLSRFWGSPVHAIKVSNVKPKRTLGGLQIAEKSRRAIRSTAVNLESGTSALSDLDKPTKTTRKLTSHQTELVQENEFERVKRNLRKVSAIGKFGMETELNTNTASNPVVPDVSEQDILVSAKLALGEALLLDKRINTSCEDNSLVVPHSSENGLKMENTTIFPKEKSSKENQKVQKRRSVPAKQELNENISHSTQNLPSYMAATVSAKAKLRGQGSPKLNEDEVELGYLRRLSLPASTNSTFSPQTQVNGKGSSKTNKSTTSSRDDKVVQPGWRR